MNPETFYSDNGPRCGGCDCTIFEYTTDPDTNTVATKCWGCHKRDRFAVDAMPATARECSRAHRERAGQPCDS